MSDTVIKAMLLRATSELPPQPGKPDPDSVTNNHTPGQFEPEYLEDARTSKGKTVVLSVQVDPSGKAASVRVLSSLGLNLDEKAMEAVGQWQWEPGVEDCKAVAMEVRAEVTFQSPEYKFALRQFKEAKNTYEVARGNYNDAASEFSRLQGDYQGRELVSSVVGLFGRSSINDAVTGVQQQANVNRQSRLASQEGGLRRQVLDAQAVAQTMNVRLQSATCTLTQRATANQKVVDLTVGDQQSVTACQGLGLYPPKVSD